MENEFLEIFAVDILATHQAYDTGTYHHMHRWPKPICIVWLISELQLFLAISECGRTNDSCN